MAKSKKKTIEEKRLRDFVHQEMIDEGISPDIEDVLFPIDEDDDEDDNGWDETDFNS